MKVFVVNCGSSSIKYQLFDMADESVLAKGLLERLGTSSALLRHSGNGKGREPVECERAVQAADHTAGLKLILDVLVDPRSGVLESIDQIDGVGHRVVHGGEGVTRSSRIDGELLKVIEANCDLAPLHNPANLAGIRAAMGAVPRAVHAAVFDTAFLATLPPHAYRYAVPNAWYAQHHVRRYGFHGTSHRYVTLTAAGLLGKPADQVHLITVHLGNGCSMTAVAGGKAVDHSMGMTPLEGLVMGTRSGDIDPAIVFQMHAAGLAVQEIDRVLNKESGLLGLSELSNDMRDLLRAVEVGDRKAALAVDVFVYRIAKYIGAYYTILPGLDAVVLTGGIGENSPPIRHRICRWLTPLGAVADEARNNQVVGGRAGPITAERSALAVWVVPTNEELMIARDTAAIVFGRGT
ncbi:MAG: acetate kinase [Phycisphaerae bacterium]|nr:acetate kinase [Phycisphaerae bacterium]